MHSKESRIVVMCTLWLNNKNVTVFPPKTMPHIHLSSPMSPAPASCCLSEDKIIHLIHIHVKFALLPYPL